MMNKARLLLIVLVAATLCGCGDDGPVKRCWGKMKGLDKVVGNMANDSYSTGRTQKPRPNANGRPVSMTDFEGHFVWCEYAATWCPACAQQSPVTKSVEQQLGDEIVFLTVMTGKSNAYNDHATVDTAREWAGRFNLPREHVVAAELWFKTVPEHRLYSPKGHTLFVHVGFLQAQQIRDVIAYYKTGWETWDRTGEYADWMYFK